MVSTTDSKVDSLTRPFRLCQPWPTAMRQYIAAGEQGGDEDGSLSSEVATGDWLANVALAMPLERLSLAGNHLGDNAIAHLAQRLAAPSAMGSAGLTFTLTDLDLSRNSGDSRIRQFDKAGRAIGELICCGSSLTRLDLSCNGIRGQSACAVGLALRNNSSLKTLKIGWNSFGTARCI